VAADPLPHVQLGQLAHEGTDLIELTEELSDFVRLRAAAGGNPAVAADVDDIGVASFRLGQRVDHALDAAEGLLRVYAVWDHVAHARHGGQHILHWAHPLELLNLLAEVVQREVVNDIIPHRE
jgi:hypothetical protein